MNIVDALNHALTAQVDISKLRLPKVVEVFNNFYGNNPFSGEHVMPEHSALDFYLANHVVALIRTKHSDAEQISEEEIELVESYVEKTNEAALRAFAYLLLICSRELRHCNGSSPKDCKITPEEKPAYDFIRQGGLNSTSANVANLVWDGNIDFEIGHWCSVLEKVFRRGSFPGGGFGGKNWANVALPLSEYVHGVYTAEMMIDTVWTLCHNNGPIFNKGMLYERHTANLYRILDVQRAGQVPNFQWAGLTSEWYDNYLSRATKTFPELVEEPNIVAIKSTAVYPQIWSGPEYKVPGAKTIKEASNHGGGITTQKMEIDRG